MLARLLIALVQAYQQVVSPVLRLLFGNVCRFEPSCSRYAVECLKMHGAVRGSLLSAVRLCKCHPFHPGGYDPPPGPISGPPLAPKADAPSCSRGGSLPSSTSGCGNAAG